MQENIAQQQSEAKTAQSLAKEKKITTERRTRKQEFIEYFQDVELGRRLAERNAQADVAQEKLSLLKHQEYLKQLKQLEEQEKRERIQSYQKDLADQIYFKNKSKYNEATKMTSNEHGFNKQALEEASQLTVYGYTPPVLAIPKKQGNRRGSGLSSPKGLI